MQRFQRLAILALFFAASVSQAQVVRPTNPPSNCPDDSDAEFHLGGAATDPSLGTIDRTGRVMAGFEFLSRIDKRIVKEFNKAWQVSGNGIYGREGVVLIFRMGEGNYTGRSQGFTNQYKEFTFRWNPATLAIVHTHPNSCNPKPSPQDERVAEKYDVPVFTITLRGMYVYNPATRVTSKVADGLDWLKLSKWQEASAGLKGGTQPLTLVTNERGETALLDGPKILVPAARDADEPPLRQAGVRRREDGHPRRLRDQL